MTDIGIRNDTVRGGVHVGGRLVQNEHLVPPQDGPGEADELRLARRQVGPALADRRIQIQAGQLDPRERLQQSRVGVLSQRVQVPAQGAGEEQRLLMKVKRSTNVTVVTIHFKVTPTVTYLGNDGDIPAQLVEAEVLGEAPADEDRPLGLRQAKERRHQRRLSGSSPAHHTDLKKRSVDAKVVWWWIGIKSSSKDGVITFSRL